MKDLKSKINEADGSYKVFLAIKGDPKLEGRFHCTKRGTLYFNGKVMNDPDFSEISVYLAKERRPKDGADGLRKGYRPNSHLRRRCKRRLQEGSGRMA